MRRLALALALVFLVGNVAMADVVCTVNASTCGGGGGGGITAGSNTTFTGTNAFTGPASFLDAANFSLKNTTDQSKILQFSLANITTATTRTITIPNVSSTMAVIGLAQTFTGSQTFSSGIAMTSDSNLGLDASLFIGPANGASNLITQRSAGTPDQTILATGTTSNAWVVAQVASAGFGFNHVAQVNPTIFMENAANDTTQHMGLAYYGSQGLALKTLTESTATSVVRIPVAAGAGVGGTVTFTAFAADATDQQTLTGVLQYAAINKAATETCPTPTLTGTALNAVSTGTLTCTYACDTTPANAVDIQFNCVSSLTQTTLDLYWRLNALGASEPLPQ